MTEQENDNDFYLWIKSQSDIVKNLRYRSMVGNKLASRFRSVEELLLSILEQYLIELKVNKLIWKLDKEIPTYEWKTKECARQIKYLVEGLNDLLQNIPSMYKVAEHILTFVDEKAVPLFKELTHLEIENNDDLNITLKELLTSKYPLNN